ncbi:MAG: metallophosphoesterase [Prevotella sp.]
MFAYLYIIIIIAIILSDVYLCHRIVHVRQRKGIAARIRMVAVLLPSVVMIAYSIWLLAQTSFAPRDVSVLNVYLFLLAMIVIPKIVYVLCSFLGHLTSRLVRRFVKRKTKHPAQNYGNIVGLCLVAIIWFIAVEGTTVGFRSVKVRHVVFSSPTLPASFDGYKILHFSDAHVGTYGIARQDILREFIDSINAQDVDAIMFTGDLQNREPMEIYPHIELLASLKSRDGVFSVLGNHDYSNYIDADASTKKANERETMRLERQMGWELLVNEHATIYRDSDSIVVAGMENDGDGKRFPRLGDIESTMKGVSQEAWVVMLQHDPSCWRRTILPESDAQLTLSGHTHAMQFAFFGWSPASLVYDEWGGMFYDGNRALNVSTGMGGFIPFRFGVPGEIVVIELRREKTN